MFKQLDILGERFREGDLSPDEFERLEIATGYRWGYVFKAMSMEAKALRRGAACLIGARLGLSEQDALAKIDSLSMVELNGALSDYEDLPMEYEDGFPPAADEG